MNKQSMQNKWLAFQRNIREEVFSESGEIKIIFNGYVEIVDLKIDSKMPIDEIQKVLPIYINKGIKSVSLKAQDAFLRFKRQENMRY